MIIQGRIITTQTVAGRITTRTVGGNVVRAVIGGGIPYDGEYVVTPEFDEQTLHTRGRSMRDDVTIHAIPISRTINPQGGRTVYIGEVV